MFMKKEFLSWVHEPEKLKQDKFLELVNVRLNDDEKSIMIHITIKDKNYKK